LSHRREQGERELGCWTPPRQSHCRAQASAVSHGLLAAAAAASKGVLHDSPPFFSDWAPGSAGGEGLGGAAWGSGRRSLAAATA
jgi:hypothetical protein